MALKKEIANIFIVSVILGIIQIIITIPAGYFSIAAVLGTAVGILTAVMNFSLMGIILEKTLSRGKAAAGLTGIGYILRLAIIAAIIIWAMKVSYLNYVCVIIPLIFPQIAIYLINAYRRRKDKKSGTSPEVDE